MHFPQASAAITGLRKNSWPEKHAHNISENALKIYDHPEAKNVTH